MFQIPSMIVGALFIVLVQVLIISGLLLFGFVATVREERRRDEEVNKNVNEIVKDLMSEAFKEEVINGKD